MTRPALSPAEIDYAVRALLHLPDRVWPQVCDHLIRTAALAEIVTRETDRAHPVLGNGSLFAALSGWPVVPLGEVDAARQARALGVLARAVSRVCS